MLDKTGKGSLGDASREETKDITPAKGDKAEPPPPAHQGPLTARDEVQLRTAGGPSLESGEVDKMDARQGSTEQDTGLRKRIVTRMQNHVAPHEVT